MAESAPVTTSSAAPPAVDALQTWKVFGYQLADRGALAMARRLSRSSPLFPNAIEDATYLRVSLGNAWLLFPVVGVVLGVLGALSTEGFAVPPTTWIYLAIIALGILDASAGLIAFVVFAVGDENEYAVGFGFGIKALGRCFQCLFNGGAAARNNSGVNVVEHHRKSGVVDRGGALQEAAARESDHTNAVAFQIMR